MKIKSSTGITLIALVITIIVMLIISGVSIAIMTGDNGILSKAKIASDEMQYAGNNENLVLGDYSNKIDCLINNNTNENLIFDNNLQKILSILGTKLTDDDIQYNSSLINSLGMNVYGPILSGNDGKAFASSEYPSLPAWYAFDGNSSRYNSGNTTSWPTIGYDFGQDVIIKTVYIENYSSDSTAIKTFNIQYSHDKTTWITANNSVFSIASNGKIDFNLDNTGLGRYWRIQILSNYGYSSYNCSVNQIIFKGIKMVQTESKIDYSENQVTNNIINKFLDSGKAQLTLNDMTTSNIFMKKIADSDQARKYLVENSQDVIQNMQSSSDVESSSNINPYMTSKTSPLGNITCSSEYYSSIYAFDSNLSNGWTPAGNELSSNSYIQYMFNENFWAYKLKIIWGYEGSKVFGFKYKVQVSNDGTNYIDISDETLVSGPRTDTINICNINKYKYFKIKFLSSDFILHSPSYYSVWVKDFRIYGF